MSTTNQPAPALFDINGDATCTLADFFADNAESFEQAYEPAVLAEWRATLEALAPGESSSWDFGAGGLCKITRAS